MLIRFSVTNYRIFHETVTLSMEATKDKRLPENVFPYSNGKRNLLKMVAIYGANASGKTALFQAIETFCDFIKHSPSHTNESQLNYTPFAFCESEEPTTMECELVFNGIRYVYGFSYDQEDICEEHLYGYPNGRKTIVFEREKDRYVFKSSVRSRTENSRKVGPKSLYVSVCGLLGDEDCSNVLEWARNDISILISHGIGNPTDILANLTESDGGLGKQAIRSFGIADLGITGIRNGATTAFVSGISVRHEFNGIVKEIPIEMESSGTIRFLSVIGPVIRALRNGNMIIIDGIDDCLHTDLFRWVVGLFHDPSENAKNAQLLLNSHDISLLDQSVIRRDQIFFTIRNPEIGESGLRRLSDYSVRNDLDIRKAYLNGSFGGKPFIAPDKLMSD